ncbi:hypothetical protein GCM10020367_63210 [Streptomyces sannanensis]|uniref:Uncharacterized protein n=1 Tax=Streptomyces sannanensis TaxID=285536 RepID=A0ABP6SLQ9_9ACTN
MGGAPDDHTERDDRGGQVAVDDFYDDQMKYVQCMRAKSGYKDFPAPMLSGYPDWDKVNEIGSQSGRNEGIKGGKNGACVAELRAASGPSPSATSRRTTSRCSRTPSACGTTASPGSPIRP